MNILIIYYVYYRPILIHHFIVKSLISYRKIIERLKQSGLCCDNYFFVKTRCRYVPIIINYVLLYMSYYFMQNTDIALQVKPLPQYS